ncbi:MAG: hypothetical protein GF344_13210 [Chitinivibrionales bacterium]|nr:hypothetical protein [Chitinivibrionales bacterium]MBD3357693.1 hypothetical protein [Chitinivibrionales bacterium]
MIYLIADRIAPTVLVLLFGAALVVGGEPVGEREVVLTALERNTDIKLVKLDLRSDSLTLEAAKAAWLPRADIGVSGRYEAFEEGIVTREADFGGAIAGKQTLPGGGTVNASTATERTRYFKRDSGGYSSELSVGYTQPLLRGAWRNGLVDYAVRIQRLDSRKFSIEQTKHILAVISRVRNLYWDAYEKTKLRAIYKRRVVYKQTQLRSARERYALGTVSLLDTLSARYEYLLATQTLLTAQIEDSLAQRALARDLAIEPGELVPDTGKGLRLGEAPTAEAFLSEARRFDPDLRIFEVLREKLAIETDHARNKLLPELSAGVEYQRNLYSDAPLTGDRWCESNTVFSLILKYSVPTKRRRIELMKTAIAGERNEINALDRRDRIDDQAKEMLLAWRKELRALEVAEASYEVALKKAEASRVGFEVGTVDRVTLLRDESDYLDATTGLLRRKIALKRLEIACDELTGAVLAKFGVTLR